MYYVLGVNCANLTYIHIEETAKVGVFMAVEAILFADSFLFYLVLGVNK